MSKPILITGPTATNKSQISLELVRKLNGEIINSDWLYLYRELKIGSGLSTINTKIPRHLYGTCSLKETLSVSEYLQKVNFLVSEILSRKRTPIIEGCSIIYNPALIKTKQFFPIALTIKKSGLPQCITDRLLKMFSDGLLNEVKQLITKQLDNCYPVKISVVYPPVIEYLRGKLCWNQMQKVIIERWIAIYEMQEDYFRKIPEIIWFEHDPKQIDHTVQTILRSL